MSRHDLGAETKSKYRLVRGYGLANQCGLWTKPAEPRFAVRTHRAAHDRQHVRIDKRGERGIAVQRVHRCTPQCPASATM